MLKFAGELHIADFGKAANFFIKIAFDLFRRRDGEENIRINSKGLLPTFIEDAGFTNVKKTKYFNTLLGTVKLISAIKNE